MYNSHMTEQKDPYSIYREYKMSCTGEDLTKNDLNLLREKERRQEALRRSGSNKAAQGLENAYGQAFQACVKAGLARQIRYKYRAVLYG
jgi:hypothetical protein